LVPVRAGASVQRGFALYSRDPMIHRTSPFVFYGSPSPFRRSSSSYVPTCLPFRRFTSTRTLTISLRAIHDRFACRLVFSRHVLRLLPSISRVLSFVQRARGFVVETVLCRTMGPEGFYCNASCVKKCVRDVCICVRVIVRKMMPLF